MKRSKEHIRESAVSAAFITAGLLILGIGMQLVGFRKYGPPLKPKTILEIAADWPRHLLAGVGMFIVIWIWQASKKETVFIICESCQETYDKDKTTSLLCTKCKGQLVTLDGFYDKNPGAK